mgnify:CR=1 FL=1
MIVVISKGLRLIKSINSTSIPFFSSISTAHIGHYNKYSKIEMVTSTIDEFCRKESIEKIDLLKIDTEGHEEYVIKGAYKTLEKKLIDVIYVEVSDKKKDFNSKKGRITDYLNKLNYKFIKEYPIKSVSLLSNLKSSDILFVKKDKIDL